MSGHDTRITYTRTFCVESQRMKKKHFDAAVGQKVRLWWNATSLLSVDFSLARLILARLFIVFCVCVCKLQHLVMKTGHMLRASSQTEEYSFRLYANTKIEKYVRVFSINFTTIPSLLWQPFALRTHIFSLTHLTTASIMNFAACTH